MGYRRRLSSDIFSLFSFLMDVATDNSHSLFSPFFFRRNSCRRATRIFLISLLSLFSLYKTCIYLSIYISIDI